MCERGHASSCKYTPDGSISMSITRDIIKLMTGNNIKKLSGLGDIKVKKGRDNWIRFRHLVSEVFGASAAGAKKQRIDNTETWYLTDFSNHLGESDHACCCCMVCGFHDKGKETKM